MKHGSNIAMAIFLIAGSIYSQQVNMRGVDLSGAQTGSGYEYEKSVGMIAAWRADHGISYSSSTNVFAWGDLSGNGYTLRRYDSTVQPVYDPDYQGAGREAIVAVTNSTKASSFLENRNFENIVSGVAKSYTIIALQRTEHFSPPKPYALFALNWSGATNNNASTFLYNAHNNSGNPTAQQIRIAADTNQVFRSIGFPGGFAPGNWFIATGMNDANTFYIGRNLEFSSGTFENFGQTTFDTFTLGATRRSGDTVDNVEADSGYAEVQFYTNSLIGVSLTNVINNINDRWSVY